MGLCLCGHILDDDGQLSASQSFAQNIAVLRTRIKARKMPVVSLMGDPTVVSVHAANVAERFGFACLDITHILAEEAAKQSNRGKIVRSKTQQGKRVPDRIMVDIIKERMIKAGDTRGYILAGFPLSPKQSSLFTRELTPVDCVVLLHGVTPQQRLQPRHRRNVMHEGDSKGVGDKKHAKDKEKEKEEELVREIVEAAGGKWDLLVEKINSNEPPADIFIKIEAAIMDRTSSSKI